MDCAKTRSQHDMALAAKRVAEVRDEKWASEYKGVCNSFPVMVMTCGLCQAVAFVSAKAKSSTSTADMKASYLERAHGRVLKDLSKILECSPEEIAAGDTVEYMRRTKRVLAAWIYFKRFAQAMLNVDDEHVEEEGQHD